MKNIDKLTIKCIIALKEFYTKAEVYNLLRKPKELTATEKIEAAVVAFIDEGKFLEITVADITEKAGVGKSTFYRNYRDKYDVLEQLISGFLERCANIVVRLFIKKDITHKEVLSIIVKAGLRADSELFRANDAVLVSHAVGTKDIRIIEMIHKKVSEICFNMLVEMGMSEEGAAFCTEFFVGANVIYILSNFYKTGKVDFETVELSFKLMEGGLGNEHF